MLGDISSKVGLLRTIKMDFDFLTVNGSLSPMSLFHHDTMSLNQFSFAGYALVYLSDGCSCFLLGPFCKGLL
jgi:hypothetical protein